jgi:hypothetical protein
MRRPQLCVFITQRTQRTQRKNPRQEKRVASEVGPYNGKFKSKDPPEKCVPAKHGRRKAAGLPPNDKAAGRQTVALRYRPKRADLKIGHYKKKSRSLAKSARDDNMKRTAKMPP